VTSSSVRGLVVPAMMPGGTVLAAPTAWIAVPGASGRPRRKIGRRAFSTERASSARRWARIQKARSGNTGRRDRLATRRSVGVAIRVSEPSPAVEKERRAFGSCQHFANRLSPAFTRTRRAAGNSRGKSAGQRPGAGFFPLSQGGGTGSDPVGAARTDKDELVQRRFSLGSQGWSMKGHERYRAPKPTVRTRCRPASRRCRRGAVPSPR